MVTEMLRMLNTGHFDQAFIVSLRPVEYPQIKVESHKEKTTQEVKPVVYKNAKGKILDYDPNTIW